MPVLELPKSQLTLHREELVKYGPGDSVVARHPTDQIVRIELEKTREYGMAFIVLSVFVALAFVSYQFVSSPGWSWTGVIVCLGICGLVIASVEGRKVVIETTSGTAGYPVTDLFEQAEGFVLSANAILARGSFEGDSQTAPRDDKDLVPS